MLSNENYLEYFKLKLIKVQFGLRKKTRNMEGEIIPYLEVLSLRVNIYQKRAFLKDLDFCITFLSPELFSSTVQTTQKRRLLKGRI